MTGRVEIEGFPRVNDMGGKKRTAEKYFIIITRFCILKSSDLESYFLIVKKNFFYFTKKSFKAFVSSKVYST